MKSSLYPIRARLCACSAVSLFMLALSASAAVETVWLSSLDLGKMKQGWGKPQTDRSIREQPLSIAGQ